MKENDLKARLEAAEHRLGRVEQYLAEDYQESTDMSIKNMVRELSRTIFLLVRITIFLGWCAGVIYLIHKYTAEFL
jgi:hypothetical protein